MATSSDADVHMMDANIGDVTLNDRDDSRIHTLMDGMDDLGFPTATVDSLADLIHDAQALDTNTAPLAVIFRQLLSDLSAYGHGRVLESTSSTSGKSNKTEIQRLIHSTLQEEFCPYTSLLAQGPTFLDKSEGRILALDFLIGEVQASKMMALAAYKKRTEQKNATTTTSLSASSSTSNTNNNKGKKRAGDENESGSDHIKRAKAAAAAVDDSAMVDVPPAVESSETTNDESQELSYELHLLAHTLQVVLNQNAINKALSASASAPPASTQLNGVTALKFLQTRIESWLAESPIHAQAVSLPPLFKPSDFTPKQLMVLSDVYRTFSSDYSLRIRVMRKRLEVTLQSFMWGGKGKSCEEQLTRLAATKLATFPQQSQVDEYELWSATPAVVSIARMTSREYAMRSSIKRIIIGKVPDRGGRVDTNTRLEPEYSMPAFTKRSESTGSDGSHKGHHHRGGGGGGGHHRGGGRGRGR